MTLIVQLVPEDRTPLQGSTSSGGTPATALPATPADRYATAYIQRADKFDSDLHLAFGLPDDADLSSRYPIFKVQLNKNDGDDSVEDVKVDRTLYQWLLDTFLIYGWDGIATVDAVIPRDTTDDVAGGTVVTVETSTRSFFNFTKNLIGLLVRDALSALEHSAAGLFATNLDTVIGKVKTAYEKQFKFKPQRVGTLYRQGGGADQLYEVPILKLRAQDTGVSEAQQLYKALQEPVRARVQYEDLSQQLAETRSKLEAARQLEQNKPPVSSLISSKIEDPEVRDSLKDAEKDLERLAASAKDLLKSLTEQLATSNPWGLLILDRLEPGFKQSQMEETLGKILYDLQDKASELRAHISSSNSNVDNFVPGFPGGDDVAPGSIQGWLLPADGPETAVLRLATAQGDESCLPVLSLPLWDLLVRQRLCPDDFSFVVANHYCEALRAQLGLEAERKELNKKIVNALSKGNALLSLAALFGLIAGVITGAAFLMLLAFQVIEISDNLNTLDTQLADSYSDTNAFTYEQLSRIADLGAYRERLLTGIPATIAMELDLVVLGARWPLAERALRLRGFYFDVETLLTSPEASPATP